MDIKKVAFFHTGRCGSTVLGTLLNQNPLIHWDGEVYVVHERSNTSLKQIDFLKERILKYPNKTYCFATKSLKYQHLGKNFLNMNLNSYINLLIEIGFKHFIIINRYNYLKRVVSQLIGEKRKKWHFKINENPPELTKITIDTNNLKVGEKTLSLLDFFIELDNHYLELNQKLSYFNHLNISYEKDIMLNPEVGYNKICNFLDIEKYSASPKLNKANPFSFLEVVENFDEINKVLNKTRYQWMLNN